MWTATASATTTTIATSNNVEPLIMSAGYGFAAEHAVKDPFSYSSELKVKS